MKFYKFFLLILMLIFCEENIYAINLINSNKASIFKQKLSELITANVIWARQYIISSLSELPDKKAIKNRLLRNQEKFKRIAKSFLDEKKSEQLIDLMHEHKNITVQLIESIKENKPINTIEKNWYKNIKDIAIFLNKFNPKLSIKFLTKNLNQLLKLTKQEIVFRHKKMWEEDIQNFDKILEYANTMAQSLSKILI